MRTARTGGYVRDVVVSGRAQVVGIGKAERGTAVPMTMQVHVEGWSPYELEGEWLVDIRYASALADWIPVRVDPDDLQNVWIDWDGVRACQR